MKIAERYCSERNVMRNLRTIAAVWWKLLRAVSWRPHLSTLVLLAPVLAVLVLLNWPGWRVAYARADTGIMFLWFKPYERYEHQAGTLTYLQRETVDPASLTPNSNLVEYTGWDLGKGIIDFRWCALVTDISAGICVAVMAALFIEARSRHRRSCFQFHLWELLTFTTLVAFCMSFYVARRKEYLMERDLYQSIPHDLEEG